MGILKARARRSAILLRRARQQAVILLALLLTIAAAPLAAQDKKIDVRRSKITVHVGKTGLFSAAGHEHSVTAPISSGVLNDSNAPRVEFKVEASKMEVQPDPKVSAKDQAQIQKDMQEKVLESGKYPEIAFRSSHAVKTTGGQWSVEGKLTLHGVTKPITVSVQRDGDAYAGHATIKQTDFGIKPISAGGGAVKVKNDLDIEFHILPSGSAKD